MYPDIVGRAGLSQPAAHGMQNIMLRRRAGTDAPYLHHRQHRDAPGYSPCLHESTVVWRRLPSLPYRRRPVGPAGEERGPSMLSTRRVPFVALQAGQSAPQQAGLFA